MANSVDNRQLWECEYRDKSLPCLTDEPNLADAEPIADDGRVPGDSPKGPPTPGPSHGEVERLDIPRSAQIPNRTTQHPDTQFIAFSGPYLPHTQTHGGPLLGTSGTQSPSEFAASSCGKVDAPPNDIINLAEVFALCAFTGKKRGDTSLRSHQTSASTLKKIVGICPCYRPPDKERHT